MNKIYIALIVLIGLGACRKEDDLKPTGARDDYFSVPADAKDPESVLRRKFYEDHQVHLMFNDTLRREQEGTYENGTPYWFVETIAPGYSFTSAGEAMEYTYLTELAEQEEAVKITEDYILNHLGAALLPYSIFWVKNMEKEGWRGMEVVNYFIGTRCFVFNYSATEGFTQEEFAAFYNRMFYDIILDKIKTIDLPAFEVFGDEYYDESYTDFGFSEEEPPTEEDFNRLGFLDKEYDDWYFAFPYLNLDLTLYCKALFDVGGKTGVSRAELEEKCESYPIIRQKAEILKKAIEDLGYKF